jgi:hypothetical protein
MSKITVITLRRCHRWDNVIRIWVAVTKNAAVKSPPRSFHSLTQTLIVILRSSVGLIGIVGIIVGVHHVAPIIVWRPVGRAATAGLIFVSWVWHLSHHLPFFGFQDLSPKIPNLSIGRRIGGV